MSTGAYKPSSRRPSLAANKKGDREQTRARILAAAKVAFSQHGYGANMRDIANDAGITAALIVRYFGSKERLFASAVAAAFDSSQALSGTRREQLGTAMTRLLFSRRRGVDLTAMMAHAALDPAVKSVGRAVGARSHARTASRVDRRL
jgi:AcrR family transcriptional regulator